MKHLADQFELPLNKPNKMVELIQAILNYDKQFGKPSEGSDRRRAAYAAIVNQATALKILEKPVDKP